MTKRRCLDCPRLTERSRCPDCERAKDRARGTTTERGYGSTHARLRAAWQARIDAGEDVHCWRCDSPITGHAWHLGHDDHDRSVYRGPECAACNLRAAGLMSHGISPDA